MIFRVIDHSSNGYFNWDIDVPVGGKATEIDLIARRFSIINCVSKIVGSWTRHGDALILMSSF